MQRVNLYTTPMCYVPRMLSENYTIKVA